MDQTRKFGEQTSGILEFKPKGLDFYILYEFITSIRPDKYDLKLSNFNILSEKKYNHCHVICSRNNSKNCHNLQDMTLIFSKYRQK